MTHPTPRAEIARLATLIADTQVWLAQCPLKADGFYETAEYTLQAIVDEVLAIARSDEALEHIAESIDTAVSEGEYPEDDEVAFWRHIAAIV